MIPFEHIFWSHPYGQYAVQPNVGADWHFPAGAFSSPILTLPDWYGPWPEINQAYWRSECSVSGLVKADVTISLQLVAMTYDISAPAVLCEAESLCSPGKAYSQPYNRNVTDALKAAFTQATPIRNNALQIGVRVKSDGVAMVNSSRLMIV